MWIMDFGNDDDFHTSWLSNKTVKNPWYEVDFDHSKSFNTVTIMDPGHDIKAYHLQYETNGEWKTIFTGENDKIIKIHRFDRVRGGKVWIQIDRFTNQPAIAEFGVYDFTIPKPYYFCSSRRLGICP